MGAFPGQLRENRRPNGSRHNNEKARDDERRSIIGYNPLQWLTTVASVNNHGQLYRRDITSSGFLGRNWLDLKRVHLRSTQSTTLLQNHTRWANYFRRRCYPGRVQKRTYEKTIWHHR